MRKLKDSGVEWIGEIPTDWSIGRIKYNFYLKGRIGWQGLKADEFVDNGPFLVTGTDFENGNVNWSKCYHISEERYMEAPEIHVENGDLLVTKDGTVGKVAYINNKPEKVSLNSHLLLIRPNSQLYYNKFLFWVIQSPIFDKYFSLSQNGTIMASLSQEKINNFSFPLPGMETQQCIADYLDRKCSQIDAIIARQQEVIEKLKAYKLSVITEAVTKGLNPDVPMKDSGVEWIGEIPENWDTLKLKYASSILRGKFNHRPRNDPEYYDGNYPFVQTGDVARANKYIEKYSQTLNEKGYAVSKEFPANSICMTIAANVGDVAILRFDACFPDSVVGFVPSGNIAWNYLYYALTAMKKQFVRNAIISTQLNLNIEIIKEEFIPVAPLCTQEQISKFLDDKCLAIDRTIYTKQCVIDKLTDYKKSIIYEVVTGKRRVF